MEMTTLETNEQAGEPIVVDPALLQPETLEHLAKEFILREAGQDAAHNVDLATEIPKVLKRLRRGECILTFDPATESVGVTLKT